MANDFALPTTPQAGAPMTETLTNWLQPPDWTSPFGPAGETGGGFLAGGSGEGGPSFAASGTNAYGGGAYGTPIYGGGGAGGPLLSTPAYGFNSADPAIANTLMQFLQANPFMTAQQGYGLAQQAQGLGGAQQQGAITPQQGVGALSSIYGAMQPQIPQQPWNYGQPGGPGYNPPTAAQGDWSSVSEAAGALRDQFGQAMQGLSRPYEGMIRPPNVGTAGLANEPIGPNGRTASQIRGTPYLSPEERDFYLASIGMAVGPNGQPIRQTQPMQEPVGPAGRTLAQVRGTQYLSPEERTWYLSQTGGAPPAQPGTPTLAPSPTGGTILRTPNGMQVAVQPDGSAIFPPAVEQWRGLVTETFGPNLTNAMLWIIAQESGGNPAASNGQYGGLFQSNAPGARGTPAEQVQSAYTNKYLPSLSAYPGGFGLAPWGYNNPPVHGGASSLPAQFAPRR